jgi:hypothetical protein
MKNHTWLPIMSRLLRTAALACAGMLAVAALALAAEGGAAAPGVEVPGQLEASDAIWMGKVTQVGERGTDVLEKIVPEGTKVKQGDFVFQLETKPIQQGIDAAQAEVRKDDLAVDAAKAKLEVLRGQLKAEQAKVPARIAPAALEVERLAALPEPMSVSAAESQLKAAQASLDDADKKQRPSSAWPPRA